MNDDETLEAHWPIETVSFHMGAYRMWNGREALYEMQSNIIINITWSRKPSSSLKYKRGNDTAPWTSYGEIWFLHGLTWSQGSEVDNAMNFMAGKFITLAGKFFALAGKFITQRRMKFQIMLTPWRTEDFFMVNRLRNDNAFMKHLRLQQDTAMNSRPVTAPWSSKRHKSDNAMKMDMARIWWNPGDIH